MVGGTLFHLSDLHSPGRVLSTLTTSSFVLFTSSNIVLAIFTFAKLQLELI